MIDIQKTSKFRFLAIVISITVILGLATTSISPIGLAESTETEYDYSDDVLNNITQYIEIYEDQLIEDLENVTVTDHEVDKENNTISVTLNSTELDHEHISIVVGDNIVNETEIGDVKVKFETQEAELKTSLDDLLDTNESAFYVHETDENATNIITSIDFSEETITISRSEDFEFGLSDTLGDTDIPLWLVIVFVVGLGYALLRDQD